MQKKKNLHVSGQMAKAAALHDDAWWIMVCCINLVGRCNMRAMPDGTGLGRRLKVLSVIDPEGIHPLQAWLLLRMWGFLKNAIGLSMAVRACSQSAG